MINIINENLIFIFIIGVLALSLILIIKANSNKGEGDNWNNIEERANEITRLDAILSVKYKELIELNNQIESHQLDTNVSLTKNEVKALDVYEQSGIRIPSDIIEDMSNMRLNSVSEIMDYIEIQRAYWKLENTKKAFRRSEAK
jgi:hypothetical protein